MGRPKKYTTEYVEQLADEMLEWFAQPSNFWLKDFALSKGFHWASFIEVGKKNVKFSDALKRAKDMQESKLAKMGFSKKFNPAMAIFALKNTAGWRDKQEIESTNRVKFDKIEVVVRHRKEEPAN